ncbi:peptidyl-tRNA hydrolase [Thelephora terrestris]|uniref:peptidyl-tRNA hydrolase n=1 Tax=Thelephora terrestris TaxID=56493 RepID=A0A9P6L6F2_9AGAM|nr:peptidyl-tRNA hydrolase [Thelephora terrestris]
MILSPRLLLVGLGNFPLPATRHSVGHLIIDSLATRLGIPLAYDASVHGHHGKGQVTHPTTPYEVTLYKSKSLMNVSGPSVQKILRKSSHTPQSLVLIHDSLGHKLDVVSWRLGGSANGHNGVKSVISALGTPDFHRLRIGIGRNEGIDAAEYVLQKLSNHERTFWAPYGQGLDTVLKDVERIALG